MLDFNANPILLFFLESFLVMASSLLILYVVKNDKKLLIPIPFVCFVFLLMVNYGLFDMGTFLNSDLVIHKSYLDKLVQPELFKNDVAMQDFFRAYPSGYHYLFLPFYKMGLSVQFLSKLLAIILASVTPALFYFIGMVIYKEKHLALVTGIFSFIPSIWDTIYYGLPRSEGIILFMVCILLLFKYLDTDNLIFSIAAYIIMATTLFIHPLTVVYLFIVICVILATDFFLVFKKNKVFERTKNIVLFLLIFVPALAYFVSKQKEFIDFTSWNLIRTDKLLFARVFYVDMNIFWFLFSIGSLPLAMFILQLRDLYLKVLVNKYFQILLFVVSVALLLLLCFIIFFDKLFFLKAHRLPPFISIFLYLTGIPQIKKIFDLLKTNFVLIFLFIALSFLPIVYSINSTIKYGVYPYVLHRLDNCPSVSEDATFDEISEIAYKIKQLVAVNEIVACPIRFGDVIRMYAQRSVTSSFKAGGMVTTYKRFGEIYHEQFFNSEKLHNKPIDLYKKYGSKYFLFEKRLLTPPNKVNLSFDFSILFETRNLILYKYAENR